MFASVLMDVQYVTVVSKALGDMHVHVQVGTNFLTEGEGVAKRGS